MLNEHEEHELLRAGDVARAFPHKPHASAVMRWHRVGLKIGEVRIRLDGVRVGRRIFFRPKDVRRFMDDLAEADRAAPHPSCQPCNATPSSRKERRNDDRTSRNNHAR